MGAEQKRPFTALYVSPPQQFYLHDGKLWHLGTGSLLPSPMDNDDERLSDTEVLVFATAVALPLFAGISESVNACD